MPTSAESDADQWASFFQHFHLRDRLLQPLGHPWPPPFKREFWPDGTSQITPCFRKISGVWKSYGVEPGIDIPAANTTRTVNIPSTQETDCETFPKYPHFRVNGHTWWYKQSVERLQSQHAEVRPVPLQSARLTSSKESSVTKEQINSLAKSLDELRLGIDDGDGAYALQTMQGDTLLTLVIPIPLG